LQIADAVKEASAYILNGIDPPWLEEVYISDEIGAFTFHLFVIIIYAVMSSNMS